MGSLLYIRSGLVNYIHPSGKIPLFPIVSDRLIGSYKLLYFIMSWLDENKMQNCSSQAALNPCYLVNVAMLCHVLILKKHPQFMKETSCNSLAVFTRFSCKKADGNISFSPLHCCKFPSWSSGNCLLLLWPGCWSAVQHVTNQSPGMLGAKLRGSLIIAMRSEIWVHIFMGTVLDIRSSPWWSVKPCRASAADFHVSPGLISPPSPGRCVCSAASCTWSTSCPGWGTT